jgi:hypothetical protein
MFKKIVEFFTGKKPESNSAHPLDAVTKTNPGHPGWPIPVPQAPYKLEPPAETTTLLYVPPEAEPMPYRFQPPAVETTPPVAVLISHEVEPQKKKRTFAKKPVAAKAPAVKAPAKTRAKKTP